MSYLLDKKHRRKNILRTASFLLLVLALIYFRAPLFGLLSSVSHTVFRPVLSVSNALGGGFAKVKSFFSFRVSLSEENENLKMALDESRAALLDHEVLSGENAALKEILSRKNEKDDLLLSAILGKPNRSPYDTILIDTGSSQGVSVGDLVFALGNVPIGRVKEVFSDSSKVVLFSTSGVKTEVAIGGNNIFMEIVGRGGGNFEITLPRDFDLPEGSEITLPGLRSYVVAKSKTVISDPRDPFSKALLTSPVNIQELKFVQILK